METKIIKDQYGYALHNKPVHDEMPEAPALFYTATLEQAKKLKTKLEAGFFDDVIASIEDMNAFPLWQNEHPSFMLCFNKETSVVELQYYKRWYYTNYNVLQTFPID